MLTYPRNQSPQSIVLTDVHYLLLYNDAVLLVDRRTGTIAQECSVLCSDTEPYRCRFVRDCAQDKIWLHTRHVLYGICVMGMKPTMCSSRAASSLPELQFDKRRWYLYLENALSGTRDCFDVVYKRCHSIHEKSFIHHAHSHFLLDQQNLNAAAEHFALQSVISFEEVGPH